MPYCILRQKLVRRLAVISLVATACLAAGPLARAVNLVQDFYVPLPEAQIYQADNAIVSGTSSSIFSTISIVVTGDGTVIYYDQWEDGYETNLANPTQSTTLKWGDGNDADGIPPGFAHNPLGLTNGTVITLTNSVTQPRNPSQFLWDGRDHIAANKALVITRANWPVSPGPVFAGSVSVLSTIDYGTNYISPVGQNLPNNLFKYVGMSIMAAQNNTAVTIDPTGTNGAGLTNIVLNQGESYLVNGGVMVGGRVTATKGIQADIIIGHVGAQYASDWFTLYPVAEWSSSYYTPVGSAATVSQPAYVYLFNPNTNAITVNYSTKVGSGSFAVPGTNGVYQYQMPVGSGASFVCTNGQSFYALCTVAANNTADTAYNWGFTLVPQGALTTEAHVGWAPGSADGTVDGSPVWVTALANTTLYVDYKGDHAGPLAYTNNGVIQNYDTNFTVTALQSLKIFDPSKNQTGMRVFTVDGTLITAAWGEDPDTAAPGNPYIDAGTTVIPFPVPVLKKTVTITVTNGSPSTLIGDTLLYTVEVDNKGLLPLGNTVVIDTPTTNLTYVTNSTTFNGTPIPDNPGPYSSTNTAFPLDAYGSAGYTIPVIQSQGTSIFQYTVKVIAGGVVSNSVNIGGTSISTQTYLSPPPTNGASVFLNFSTSGAVATNSYVAGANVYVLMTNAVGNTSSNTVQTINVTVVDTNTGDLETIPLVETGTNTGIFINPTGLPTSTSSGVGAQNGILYVVPGDTISVSYTDPNYGDSASASATISIPTPNKQLYLSATNALTRINPSAPPVSGTTYSSADINGSGAWPYWQTITINHAKVSGTAQTNFPVLINLASNTGLQNHAQSSGNDIMFIASDGVTVLPYEREAYTSGTGALVAWVKIPILSNTVDTVVYMYYGNASAPDQQNKTNVWDSNYQGVWHLSQTPTGTSGDMADSTAGANNGTSHGSPLPAPAAGQIDGCITLTNANSNYISTANSFAETTTNSVTVQAWIKTTTTSSNKVVGLESVQTGTGAVQADRQLYLDESGKARFGTYGTAANYAISTSTVNDGNWHSLVGIRDNTATNVYIYVDGVLQATAASPVGQSYTGWWRIGSYHINATQWGGNDGYFGGSVDEVRVSQVARSAGWVATEYNNQSSPGAFYAIGTEATNLAANLTVNAAMFTQTPVFALPFTMPAGGTVTITNFITVTNGAAALAANTGLITASLQTNGVNFLTLTNPAFGTNSAGATNLIWSSTLGSRITISTNTAITYVISNNVANSAFHVNYGSTNAPSVIVLPASTVIQISSLGVYDAPYTNGSLVTSPTAGSTVYIRAAVTDPFGYYDITSLFLSATNASAGVGFSTNLTDVPFAVYTNGAVKIYEFKWVTGPATGSYSIGVTAKEGSEGVTASAATSITTTFNDQGVPSTTQFTAGPNGTATNSYIVGSVVSIRVTALDSITNAAVVQTIPATVTSSAGDLQNIILTETGPGTGIYTNSLVTTTSGPGTNNDGILYAPASSTLTASYTNPNNASYSSSATATVLPAGSVAAVVMNKTILSPSGGQVGVSNNITFNLQAVNVGTINLTNLAISDTFPSAKLSFVSASLAPSTTNAGLLTWTNLGSFAPTLGTNLTVTFRTLATGATTNFATASSVLATNATYVTFSINNTALNVTKTLLSPTNTPVAVGSNVVFRIIVQNTGNVTVNYLPLEDTFSAAYYQFVSSTITNNGSGAGSLIWTNLASPVALAAGASITNDVTMTVVGQGTPANNAATVDYATDINGNPVPTTTSTIGVNTAAASITGHVYDDEDQSGVYNPNDPGLANVTLDLYTDPTATGTPGVLVQVVTTDVNGYYEFLNLNIGHYVIVENHLPGYDSTAPTSNQIAVNLLTLTANNNNNFFDFQPSASVYSTINGMVWYDANGNGTNNVGETNLANIEIDLFQDVNTNGQVDLGDPLMFSTLTSTNGSYSIFGVTPGHYVIRQVLPYGYYSTGDSQGRTDSQLVFVSTNGVVSTNNSFYDRLSPTAVADTGSATNYVPVTLYPLTNDLSPNGDALTITNVTSTNGLVVINPGSTNITFTPTNLGTTTITYIISDGHGGTSSAVITVNVTALANLAIGKTAAPSIYAASNLLYTIAVTNLGPSPASSVVVTDALPAGVTFVSASGGWATNAGVVSWSLGSLTNNQVSNVTVTVTVPASGSLTNTANVSSPTPDPNLTNNVSPPVVTSVTPVADVAVVTAGPGSVVAGMTYTNTITVTNGGPSTATNVVVVDTLPDGTTETNSYPILPAGGSTNFNVTYVAPGTGPLTNTVVATAGTYDPNLVNNTNVLVTAVTLSADVAIGKTGPAGMVFGTNFNYTIAVTNFGPSIASGISVTDALPAGLVFVGAVPAAASTNAGVVVWTNFTLVANATTNLTLTVSSTLRGSITNIAAVGSTNLDPNVTNNTSPPAVTAITNIPPVANPDSYVISENTTNTFNVTTNDQLLTPGGHLTVISVSPTNGIASILNGTNVVFTPTNNFLGTTTIGYTVIDNVGGTNSTLITVLVTNVPPIANPDSYTVNKNTTNTFNVTVNDLVQTPGGHLTVISVSPTNGTATIQNGTNVVFIPTANFVGTATIGYTIIDNVGGTNSTLVTVLVTNIVAVGADIQVLLTGPAIVTVGDAFTFTTTVTNAGPLTATNTYVTNALSANLTVAGTTGGGVSNNGVVTWPVLPLLANGQATNLTVTVKTTAASSTTSPTANPYNFILTNSPPAAGTATNRASAFAATLDPNLTNNTASLSYTNALAQTVIVPGVFSVVMETNTYPTNVNPTSTVIPIGTDLFIAGTNAFNPQTQLYEEFVSVTNIGLAPVHALRLSVGGLPSRVTLYNGTGTNNGVPYVEYDPPYNSPLNPYPQAGNSVTFTLEFFVTDRRPFTNSLTATAIIAPVVAPVNSTNGATIVQSGFNDVRNPANPRFLVEFTSIPGRTYTVEYSDDDMVTWQLAVPSIVASTTSTFWYDDGPPVTVTPPPYPNAGRFYRVLLNP